MEYTLIKQGLVVYKTIQQEIEAEAAALSNEIKWIEWAFGVSWRAWARIEKKANSYRFPHQHEEIYFYKNLKPRFIGLIDYFSLRYKSILFKPDDCIRTRTYWKRELKDCAEMLSWFKASRRHYENQQSVPNFHFLQQNNQQPVIFGQNITPFNITSTSYCYLLGRMIALEKYKKFIEEKIA